MNPTTPTALDWLRYTRARGLNLVDLIDSHIGDCDGDPRAEAAVAYLEQLRELLAPLPLPGVPGHYSDGRPVWSQVELGSPGYYYLHHWHPEPDHPDNQPHDLCTIWSGVGRYRIAVTAPMQLEATPTLALCTTPGDDQ